MAAIGIVGSAGRMGQALAAAIDEAGETQAGGADRGDDVGALAGKADALVDFSTPGALADTLAILGLFGVLLVPFSILVFAVAERWAKRTGKLKRQG